jgi:hypothetical protein
MTSSPRRRRNFISAAIASLVACVFAKESNASPVEDDSLVRTRMRRGNPPTQPLDTMLLFERGDENCGRAMTHEVLSLIHEEKGKNSYPWTFYASLDTHHETGDACVVCARLHKHGPGWSSGLHSEVFNHNRAVALGVNIEMSNDYAGSEPAQVIGLNIQAVGGPAPMQYAIHVHDKDEHASFQTGIGLNGRGSVGIDLAGNYDIGINTRHNNIRLAEGACIELDERGEVKIRYREGKIEFLKGQTRVGFIDMSGSDHAL